VVHAVKHAHDLTVNINGERNPQIAAQDNTAHRFGDRGLAVAGRAVQEDRLAGIDRRADLVEHLRGDHQILERPHKLLVRHRPASLILGVHRRDVLVQRHRAWPGILRPFQRLASFVRSLLGDDVLVRGRANPGSAPHLKELLPLQKLHDAVNDTRIRQADEIRDLLPGHEAAEVHDFDDKVRNTQHVQPGIRHGAHDRRRPGLLRRSLCLGR